MVKGSIGDRILECIGYPENWTEQEIEDNKQIIQEEFLNNTKVHILLPQRSR